MERTCPSCGTRNRIPADHLTDVGTCGKCKTALPVPGVPFEVDDVAQFDAIVKGAKVPVLVDFWAPWCGPCRMVGPEVARAASEVAGRAVVMKVNTDVVPQLAQRYHVSSIPNLAVFRGGSPVVQRAGVVNHSQMVKWIDDAV